MASEGILKNIVNNFLEHVLVLNSDKKIIFQTNDLISLLGFNAKEIEHLNARQLFISPTFSLDAILAKAKKIWRIHQYRES